MDKNDDYTSDDGTFGKTVNHVYNSKYTENFCADIFFNQQEQLSNMWSPNERNFNDAGEQFERDNTAIANNFYNNVGGDNDVDVDVDVDAFDAFDAFDGADGADNADNIDDSDNVDDADVADDVDQAEHTDHYLTNLGNYLKDGKAIEQKNMANVHTNLKDAAVCNQRNAAMVSDDMRISKILRRLIAEENADNAIELCKKLNKAVRSQSNASYICRSFDYLFDNMIVVLKQSPLECLALASSVLGILGYIKRADYVAYKMHLTKAYASYPNIRKYLMMALKTTLSCDAVNLNLTRYSERLLRILKDYLENADSSDQFVAICDTIVEFSKHYKLSFQQHFTDVVDIIVGWHLELDQSTCLKRHCARVLQQLTPYFMNEVEFTYGLLGQFIEDIETNITQISIENISLGNIERDYRVGAFIGAFISIIKALYSNGHNSSALTQIPGIFCNAFIAISKAAKQFLEWKTILNDESIINLNEFLCLLCSTHNLGMKLPIIQELIELQFNCLDRFNDSQQCSLLYLIYAIVHEMKTQLPLSFVAMIMKRNSKTINELKLNANSKSYKLLLKVYHEILLIKNVPLLQEAYHHIIEDIQILMTILSQRDNINDVLRSEVILNFYIAALAVLATQTSSIIGMYALNPSILELLINNFQAININLWSNYPTMHNSLLQLIRIHCCKNHNFRQTSRLNSQQHDIISPTSEHFAIILGFLSKIFVWHESAILQEWFTQILISCKTQPEILLQCTDFLQICKSITMLALRKPREYSKILMLLLNYSDLPKCILIHIRDIALCMLDSFDMNVCNAYRMILAKIPLNICLALNSETILYCKQKQKIRRYHHWRKTTHLFAILRAKIFRAFIESSLSSSQSLYHQTHLFRIDTQRNYNNAVQRTSDCHKYIGFADRHSTFLYSHLQYEASRHCVQQKLRTSFGKPQETLLIIEEKILHYARLITIKEQNVKKNVTTHHFTDVMKLQQSLQSLLSFLEQLEKHMYNAAEGTAYAMLPAEKPVKTFFRINEPTCREWFKRLRPAVTLTALHCLQPEMTIRYAEMILQMDCTSLNPLLFSRCIIALCSALLMCGESDALQGVYIWLKKKSDHLPITESYTWIQYAAEQASGRLEQAANGYANILRDASNKTLNSYTIEFLRKQLCECMYYTARWSEIPRLLGDDILYSNQHLQIMESIYENCFTNYWQENYAWLRDNYENLTWWANPLDSNSHNEQKGFNMDNYGYDDILLRIEDTCMHVAVSLCKAREECIETLRTDVIPAVFKTMMQNGFELNKQNKHFIDLITLNNAIDRLTSFQSVYNIPHDDWYDNKCRMDDFLLSYKSSKFLLWSMVLEQGNFYASSKRDANISLLLTTAANVRYEGNINYCRSLLGRFFSLKGLDGDITEIMNHLQSVNFEINYENLDVLHGVNELSKCMYASQTNTFMEALELESVCCLQIIKQNNLLSRHPSMSILCDILLTMADWLVDQRLNSAVNWQAVPQFNQLLHELPNISFCTVYELLPGSHRSIHEQAIGQLLNASVECKPEYATAWYAFGSWCYRWGKKIIEASNIDANSPGLKEVKLNKTDITNVSQIIGSNAPKETIKKIVNCLNTHSYYNDSAGIIKDAENDRTSTSKIHLLKTDLRKIVTATNDQLNAIVSIWQNSQTNMYAYYKEATRAYFKYLTLASADYTTNSHIMSNGSYGYNFDNSTLVTTTLRLLRLIVKHADSLQDVLEEGLSNTPLRPWRIIVPQLFSRLNHHEPYVRRSVSDLLCRLSYTQPQLIIFPAVVGAQQELNYRDGSKHEINLSNCFGTLLQTIATEMPETVLHVQLLVKELRRIALLWEDFWLMSLTQLYAEYSSVYNALEAKKAISIKNDNLMKVLLLQYEIFLKHLHNDFYKIVSVTDKVPETNYERHFQERFKTHIANVLQEFEKPFALTKVNECWIKIKQLYHIIQQKPIKANLSTLKVSDISPVLSNMQNTEIAMPGVDTYEHSNDIYIRSVDNVLHILPTKTKPKKLSFMGSNGQQYTFLFKGQEDLHLDERIMQFLSISNSMMARSTDMRTKTKCFMAHHYSVIPLGSQSGLISWVDGVTPLFALYKKWQQRESLHKQQQTERNERTNIIQNKQNSITANAGNNVTRPTELFYDKLKPLLAEHNLKITDPRKMWPIKVLRQVLRELTAETPKNLLSQEIWCQSLNIVDWYKSVRRFTRSLAVMSIIGYIIGLGDRHLDNILINLSTGEIIHIDYNVCFEKGKTLKVPEKIPFRLTPNLMNALGLTGIEGAYRLACEYVLKTLRKERETLLTLLEAFVYDPLVDWTVSDDGTTTAPRLTTAHQASAKIAAIHTNSSISYANCYKDFDTVLSSKCKETHWKEAADVRCHEISSLWIQFRCAIHAVCQRIYHILPKSEDSTGGINSYNLQIKQTNDVRNESELPKADTNAANSLTDMNAFPNPENIESICKTYFQTLLNAKQVKHQIMLPWWYELSETSSLKHHQHFDNTKWLKYYEKLDLQQQQMHDIMLTLNLCCVSDVCHLMLSYSRFMHFSKGIRHLNKLRSFLNAESNSNGQRDRTQRQILVLNNEDSVDSDFLKNYLHAMEHIYNDLYTQSLEIQLQMINEKRIANFEVTEQCTDNPFPYQAFDEGVVQQYLLSKILTLYDEFYANAVDCFTAKDSFLIERNLLFIEVLTDVVHHVMDCTENNFDNINEIVHKLSVNGSYKSIKKDCTTTTQTKNLALVSKSVEQLIALKQLFIQTAEDLSAQLITFDRPKLFAQLLQQITEETDMMPSNLDANTSSSSSSSLLLPEASILLRKLMLEIDKFVNSITNVWENLQGYINREDVKVYLKGSQCLINFNKFNGKSEIQSVFVNMLAELFKTLNIYIKCLRKGDEHTKHVYDIRTIDRIINEAMLIVVNNVLLNMLEMTVRITHAQMHIDLPSARELSNDQNELYERLNVICHPYFEDINAYVDKALLQHRLQHQNKLLEVHQVLATGLYWSYSQQFAKINYKQFITTKSQMLNVIQNCKQIMSISQSDLSDIHNNMEKQYLKLMQEYHNEQKSTTSNSENNRTAYGTIFTKFFDESKQKYTIYMNLIEKFNTYCDILLKFESTSNTNNTCSEAFISYYKELQQERQQSANAKVNDKVNASSAAVAASTTHHLEFDELIEEKIYQDNAANNRMIQILKNNDISNLCESNNENILLKKYLNEMGEKLEEILQSTNGRWNLRQLLKAFVKAIKPLLSSANGAHGKTTDNAEFDIREFQQSIKLLQSKITDWQMHMMSEEFDVQSILHLREKIEEILRLTQQTDCKLNQFMENFKRNSNEQYKDTLETDGIEKIENMISTQLEGGDRKVGSNQVNEQRRNAYAVSVWKRIRMKLEGRDPDPNRRSSVGEQVDFVINEAINEDNLATLYEGWTPWV